MAKPLVRIGIFASGSGSNAEAIIQYFNPFPTIEIAAIFTNKPKAGVVKVAESYQIPVYSFHRHTLQEETQVLDALNKAAIDFIVLAGFLLLMPASIVNAYQGRIINLHPALLPKYGGKGMYGKAVHEAVKRNGESQTGITIHYVNQVYDDGQIIRQFKCPVDPEMDSVSDIEQRVRALEVTYYPPTIQEVLEGVYGPQISD